MFCDNAAMDETPLDAEVRSLLEARRGEWPGIAEGAGISHSWISQFVRGKIPNPGFVTLTALRSYLLTEKSRAEAGALSR